MIEERVKKGIKKKTEDTTLQHLKKNQYFFIGISMHTNNINLCIHIVISLQNNTEQPKDTNLTTFRKLKSRPIIHQIGT